MWCQFVKLHQPIMYRNSLYRISRLMRGLEGYLKTRTQYHTHGRRGASCSRLFTVCLKLRHIINQNASSGCTSTVHRRYVTWTPWKVNVRIQSAKHIFSTIISKTASLSAYIRCSKIPWRQTLGVSECWDENTPLCQVWDAKARGSALAKIGSGITIKLAIRQAAMDASTRSGANTCEEAGLMRSVFPNSHANWATIFLVSAAEDARPPLFVFRGKRLLFGRSL